MLEVKMFAENVAQNIEKYLPEELRDVECEITEQQKNNGVLLTGIVFRRLDQAVSPLVYMNPYYEQVRQGCSMEQIMGDITQIVRETMTVKDVGLLGKGTDYLPDAEHGG